MNKLSKNIAVLCCLIIVVSCRSTKNDVVFFSKESFSLSENEMTQVLNEVLATYYDESVFTGNQLINCQAP
jgi:hypothetical protein